MSMPLDRARIPAQYKWNAESVFPDRAAWRAEKEAVLAAIPALSAWQGRLGESAAALADCLNAADALRQRVGKLWVYASFAGSVDSADGEATGMIGQVGTVFAQVESALAFIDPEMLAIGAETLRRWVSDEPRLSNYAHMIDDLLRRQAHVRSAEVEALLGMAIEPLFAIDRIADELTDTDLRFADAHDSAGAAYPVMQSTWEKLRSSPDRALRRSALESYADGYLAFRHTLTANYLAAVRRDVFLARARGYASSLEASLFANHIAPEVYHTLIATYRRNIPTWHRYWEVRRRILGVETLHPYDIWAPLTPDEPVVPYEQAVEMICAGMAPLGEEYVGIMRRGLLEERWVDVYPNTGKRQGAFSSGVQGTHPFIMMSYDDDLPSLSTLAHELGHSMHSYYSNRAQAYVNTHYSLFVAEVASNFNQATVRAHLMRAQTDPAFQIALLNEAMYNLHRYFFIMPILAQFELEVHERIERGNAVTADDLIALCADLYEEGYGGMVTWERERIGITWAQFTHLYSNFYVFQYATGISAAHALSAPIVAGDADAARRYLDMLSAGGSVYPTDALRAAGVDMTTPAAVEKTFETLAGYVARLDELTRV